ncbi:MAG: SCP2 sterol-binding domain-containing protein [Lachnospiraceae bacterium]|nr:SCP2 sterol-binding domain-containing protein [Lachnospiraceae bacterium]
MKHYDTLDGFVSDLPALAAGAKERLAGQTGLFRLETKQGRVVNLRMEDGAVTLPETVDSEPDCVLSADEQDLLGIINGSLHPAKALLFGKVRVKGNPAKILSLISLL